MGWHRAEVIAQLVAARGSGQRVAEIGVLQGITSAHLLLQPEVVELLAVDPYWNEEDGSGDDLFAATYSSLLPLSRGRLRFRRAASWNVADEEADESFDVVLANYLLSESPHPATASKTQVEN